MQLGTIHATLIDSNRFRNGVEQLEKETVSVELTEDQLRCFIWELDKLDELDGVLHRDTPCGGICGFPQVLKNARDLLDKRQDREAKIKALTNMMCTPAWMEGCECLFHGEESLQRLNDAGWDVTWIGDDK